MAAVDNVTKARVDSKMWNRRKVTILLRDMSTKSHILMIYQL